MGVRLDDMWTEDRPPEASAKGAVWAWAQGPLGVTPRPETRLCDAPVGCDSPIKDRRSDRRIKASQTNREPMLPKFATFQIDRRRAPFSRSGFSMLEMLLVLIIISVLVGIVIPKIARIIRHERVNRAAQVVVQDLQNGFATAGRQRAPVRLTFYPSTKTYEFTDRATGTVIQTRVMRDRKSVV